MPIFQLVLAFSLHNNKISKNLMGLLCVSQIIVIL